MISKKLTIGFLLILSGTYTAFSQKLPAKQEAGVYAPSNVKLDGKITEWGNLQAYNTATEMYYTMANDDDNLYLICSATEEDAIQKIVLGGITLTISAMDKKANITPAGITYPIVPWVNTQINYDLREKAPLKASLVSSINEKISSHLKEIKISGFKDFPEGSIPVYNEQGIVGAQYVSKDKVYTYELALPLKFIRHLINDQDKFNYKVQINGQDKNVITISAAGGSSGNVSAPSDQGTPHGALYDTTPTYFNASYTLSKK